MRKNIFKIALMLAVVISALHIMTLSTLADTKINNVTVRNLGEYGLDLLTVALDTENVSAASTVYIAVYDTDGGMTDCVSISDGTQKTTVSNKNAAFVKVFIWDKALSASCSAFTQTEIK